MIFEKKNTYDFIVDCSISNASAMEILQFACQQDNIRRWFFTNETDGGLYWNLQGLPSLI